MDKKTKQHRHKNLTEDELSEIAPRGASFDTEEGRAAQGMRSDVGVGAAPEERKRDEPAPKPHPDAADEDGGKIQSDVT